jgi:methylated-DNA-[protein]-cysteine S-methyltransferase
VLAAGRDHESSHTRAPLLVEDDMTTLIAPSPLAVRQADSPFGPLTIVGSTAGLRAILWPGDDPARAGLDGVQFQSGSVDSLDEAASQLDDYFAGTRTVFDLPFDLHGTAFQLAAWRALAEIPYGETRTYAEQAARLGRPAAVRAVGTANGRNPLSIVLPCHRVVGSDGTLRGFAGGLEVKAGLLAFEHEIESRDRTPG